MASDKPEDFEDISDEELEAIYANAQPFASDELMYAAIEQLNSEMVEKSMNIQRPNIVKANPYRARDGKFSSASGGRLVGGGGKKGKSGRAKKFRRGELSDENKALRERQEAGTKTRAEAKGVEDGVYAVSRQAKGQGGKKPFNRAVKTMLKDYDKMYNKAVKDNDPDPQGAADSQFTRKYGATVLQVENVATIFNS